MKDRVKEINYEIYLQAERIRLAKIAIRKLKLERQMIQEEKGQGGSRKI